LITSTNSYYSVIEMATTIQNVLVQGIRVSLLVSLAGAPVGNRIFAADPAKVDFARDVQPIFVKRCYECHGPDKQKSGLRLDRKPDAAHGGKSEKPFWVAGKSAESQIIDRVTTANADDQMPPKGERLTAEQVRVLRAWIDEGAVWPDEKKHWAFVKPVRQELPPVKNKRWPRNEIDYFILARLEREKLSVSPEADRATLIRRLSFDLTGLPPTMVEVDSFLKDRSNQAYEQAVDRLLASQHFGEHLGRGWLDLARYADSNGYQVDLTRSMWPYREWVINAFNRNLPFDQFTIEQLAGDLLPNATLEQKIATGFHRNTKTNDEGGGDDEEYRTKAVKDRVATTATTWLGLTMMCAECHTHKYDPITQDEYYRFYGFFNSTADRGNSTDPSLAVPPPSLEPTLEYLRGQISKLRQELVEAEKQLPVEQATWEHRMTGKTNVWVTLDLTKAVSTGGAAFTNLPDQSILATGINSIYDTYQIEAATGLQNITAILLEVLPDPSLPKNGPGRWGKTGNFILDELGMTAAPKSAESAEPINIFFSRATADWEQQYYRAEHAVDHNPKSGWAIGPKFGERHFLIAELKSPVGFASGTKLGFRFDSYHGNSHTIGRLRLSITAEQDPAALWPVPSAEADVLGVPVAQRSAEQQKLLAAHYRSVSPTIRNLEREIARLNERETELADTKYTTLVMKERNEPRTTFVHIRGNFLDKGKEVTPGTPVFLPPLPDAGPTNRLAMARWLVSPENPLTARVTANRMWERVFGTGLVKTSEDFGKQGEPPSHPELLDWLACEFMQPSSSQPSTLNPQPPHGWDVKHLLKLIVMSATYRQSATASDEHLEKDPFNRLLARGPRFRLDAEMIRDQALTVSGLLNPEIGGPSVYPAQVPNLWKELGFLRPEIGMDEWPVSEGPELYRRAVYTFWRRVCTYPTFATFDAPSREVCTSRRPRTDTPLQALAALNEPTLLEAARVFAQRILREGGANPARQVEFAFRTCLSRPPTKAERERLLALYEQQLKSFEHDPQSATQLVSQGTAAQLDKVDVRKLAAWTMVANALLNLDETLTKG
jgi:mono/diheme cytochrome c family protein